jgi:hypothetical protein
VLNPSIARPHNEATPPQTRRHGSKPRAAELASRQSSLFDRENA